MGSEILSMDEPFIPLDLTRTAASEWPPAAHKRSLGQQKVLYQYGSKSPYLISGRVSAGLNALL